ncbi:MAG: flagellar hook assembly protein FlgD [Pseudomonadales bacterium]|nr:flagellar hook assembly protein FlgD [Pseudomonadales bacterium]MCP5184724.1 flagellar hook assembly protein FlgD [Pseudomonadales bacterium]
MDVAGIRSLSDLQQSSAGGSVNNGEELGKTAFLELMLAQIRNQSPLDPSKNEEFVAQLAQFSSVEGIQNLNESMSTMADAFKSSLTLNAAAMVGRSVMVPTSQVYSEGGGFAGVIDNTEVSASLNVEITDGVGRVVRMIDLGGRAEGSVRFTWDGKADDGTDAPAGLYSVRAFNEVNGEAREFDVQMPDRVVSVSIKPEGAVANLAGGDSVPVAAIKEIL